MPTTLIICLEVFCGGRLVSLLRDCSVGRRQGVLDSNASIASATWKTCASAGEGDFRRTSTARTATTGSRTRGAARAVALMVEEILAHPPIGHTAVDDLAWTEALAVVHLCIDSCFRSDAIHQRLRPHHRRVDRLLRSSHPRRRRCAGHRHDRVRTASREGHAAARAADHHRPDRGRRRQVPEGSGRVDARTRGDRRGAPHRSRIRPRCNLGRAECRTAVGRRSIHLGNTHFVRRAGRAMR